MTYERARTRAVQDVLFCRLSEFLERYRPGQPTVLFLPGGMGSQLARSSLPYGSGDSLPPTTRFSTIWYDLGLIFDRDLDHLRVQSDEHDAGDHVVVPDGEVRFAFRPYDKTESFFRQHNFNYLVFGFDWRRTLGEAAGYLDHFLTSLRNRVAEKFREDPLKELTIIGHSQGGLVLKTWLLRTFPPNVEPSSVDRRVRTIVMVGTPFYGTTNHLQRYYEGETAFSLLRDAATVLGIMSSLPGPYVLLPMPNGTFEAASQVLLERGLRRYPVRDRRDPDAMIADPYSPDNVDRYPPWVNRALLRAAGRMHQTLAMQLPPAVAQRTYNLRSVADGSTATELLWEPIDGSRFQVGDRAPFETVAGPGDGTVPAWSGALVEIPNEQVIDLVQASGHVGLMEHRETLAAIHGIMQERGATAPLALANESPGVVPVARDEFRRFLAPQVHAPWQAAQERNTRRGVDSDSSQTGRPMAHMARASRRRLSLGVVTAKIGRRRVRISPAIAAVCLGILLHLASGCGNTDPRPRLEQQRASVPALSTQERLGRPVVPAGLTIDPIRVDLGDVEAGKKVHVEFRLSNVGTRGVTVHAVKAACACIGGRLLAGELSTPFGKFSKTVPVTLAPHDPAKVEVDLLVPKGRRRLQFRVEYGEAKRAGATASVLVNGVSRYRVYSYVGKDRSFLMNGKLILRVMPTAANVECNLGVLARDGTPQRISRISGEGVISDFHERVAQAACQVQLRNAVRKTAMASQICSIHLENEETIQVEVVQVPSYYFVLGSVEKKRIGTGGQRRRKCTWTVVYASAHANPGAIAVGLKLSPHCMEMRRYVETRIDPADTGCNLEVSLRVGCPLGLFKAQVWLASEGAVIAPEVTLSHLVRINDR